MTFQMEKNEVPGGCSLLEIARKINPRVRGWIDYFGKFYLITTEDTLAFIAN